MDDEAPRPVASRKLLFVFLLGLLALSLMGGLGVLLFGGDDGKGRPPAYVVPAPPPPVIGSGEAPNPHLASREEAAADEALCLGCHADPVAGSLKEPTVRATCEGCHPADPRDPQAGHSHPLDVRVLAKMTAAAENDPPLGRGRMITCTSCHDPHEQRPPYLRGGTSTAACSTCHPGF